MTQNGPDKDEKAPKNGLYMITDEEMRLILRLRQLSSGSHLAIIQCDGRGFYALSVMSSGKVEMLRRNAEQV